MSDTVKLPFINMDSDDPRDEIKQKDFAKCLAGRLEGHKTRIETALHVCDFLSLHVDDGLDDMFTVFVNVLAGLLADAEDIQGDFAKLAAPILYGKEVSR